ncbi:nitronate monooxygenase [bacterium]|nr:nitronate monooxygenase [bacterium]
MAIEFKTRITEMLGIEHPILCGGMQWISRGEFVASVCNAGGLGFITAESFPTAQDLRDEIRKMRDLTDKPFGVNISMVPEFGVVERTMQFCDVVCEENVGVVETAGKSPEALMPKLKKAGIKIIHKLTTVRHAVTAQRLGVDAVTLVGFGSGGHVGMDDVANMILIPAAASRLEIPVIAGGAIADGRGLVAALALGAEAVLMGTRFMVTEEAPIHDSIKERLIRTAENDTAVVMRSIKNPARCVHNKLAEEILEMEEKGATLGEIVAKMSGKRGLEAYYSGDCESSPIGCGQIAGLIDEVKSVEQVIQDMISEAEKILGRLNGLVH